MASNIDFVVIKDAVELVNKNMDKFDFNRIESGFRTLDFIKGGWIKGEFSVIGGRPGMGKTGFIISIISNLLQDNIPVSLFSAKNSMNEELIAYLVSCIKFQNIEHTKEDKVKLLKSVDLSNIPFFLNIQSRMTLAYIRDNARILVEKHGVKCIFIESIQNIFNSEENGNAKEGMEKICHELKLMARDLNVPLIVTSDLNRAVEHREGFEGKEPLLSDLRGSSAIEFEADSILLLHRPSYYGINVDEQGNSLQNIEIVKIQKNKSGLGDVFLKYCYEDGTVEEICGGKRSEYKTLNNILKNTSDIKLMDDLELKIVGNKPF